MEQTVKIDGMKCDGCVKTVTEKFSELPGVTNVAVSLENKTATITSAAPVELTTLNAALAETKFTAAN
jgi:copper chaperone